MFRNGAWRVFLAGALYGGIFMAALGGAWIWWKPFHELGDADVLGLTDWRPVRSAEDEARHDMCLAAGNTVVACDALMRMLDRERIAVEAMKKEAAKMLAAGVTKRDVVKWAIKKGFTGSQLSDAVGISWEDLRDDKY